jgi:hypothetical protein
MSDTPNRSTPTVGGVQTPQVNTGPAKPVTIPQRKTTQSMIPALETKMGNFIKVMDTTKQLTLGSAAKAQDEMWQTLNMIFARPPNEFPELWGRFLEIVHEHNKGVFAPASIFRGVPQATRMGSAINKKNFIRLMNLARDTADPSTRALKMKHISLKRVVRQFTDPGVANRLAEFYRV